MATKRVRKQEDTHIDQQLYPKLEKVGIKRTFIKRNVTTLKSGKERGDIWISDIDYTHPKFEERILCLIEAKDKSCSIGDKDWKDAIKQGKSKALKQGLNTFFVTNTDSDTRCYNSFTGDEIKLDGEIVSQLQPLSTFRAIQTQSSKDNSDILINSFAKGQLDARLFRSTLWNLRQIFRARGISKGSEESMIKMTLTFSILKLISEQQKLKRTLPKTIMLWDDWREGKLDKEIATTISELLELDTYKHLKDSLFLDDRLDLEACQKIKREFNQYKFHSSDFDLFGLIYESFANKEIKKDFGEFYTPRHLIRSLVKLLLRTETTPRNLKICDPACGTGGFLVESFLFLQRLYEQTSTLKSDVLNKLKNNTFYGFDTNGKVAIPFARTNMLMADDGGANIQVTEDSLIDLPTEKYDYVLANVPYGSYGGSADMSTFSLTNNKRLELLFTEKIIESLKPGGKAVVIVPDGLVESTSLSTYRAKLLRKVNMEAIISLPPFIFEPYTSEKTYTLIFSRKSNSEERKFQINPIWHFIIDNDGFQDGKKRYPIFENDLPIIEDLYCKEEVSHKCRFVNINECNADNYYSFSSETYLRKIKPIEISITQFQTLLKNIKSIIANG